MPGADQTVSRTISVLILNPFHELEWMKKPRRRWFGSTFSDSLPRYELLVIAPGSSVIKSPQHVAVCLWVWRGSKQPTAILNHTKQGELVYDPFLGSGTTLVAAELTERVCFGLELDSRYCDVIIERCYTGPGSTEYMVC
jgi:hypothetical protein